MIIDGCKEKYMKMILRLFAVTIFLISTTAESTDSLTLQNGLYNSYPAPQIEGITYWINSPPLQLNNLKGKVVLIDFWTYSCINCLRTLPFLKDWYHKYHDSGLVIIGIHAPEFEFEKNIENVKNAVAKDGIQYPVALDNQFMTWQNYHNQYWPAHYLIDKNGRVVYTHFGEGDYLTTENNIRFLLGMKQPVTTSLPENGEESIRQTPETYLGYARSENFSNKQSIVQNKAALYLFPEEISEDHWALNGEWAINSDKIISVQPNVGLKINFNAHKVFMVMGSASGQPVKVKVLLNGEPVINGKGKDVIDSRVMVSKHTLYEVLDLPHFDSGILQIIPETPGLEVYTFTFG